MKKEERGIYRLTFDDLAEAFPQIGVGFVTFLVAAIVGALNPQIGGAAMATFGEYVQDMLEMDTPALIVRIFVGNASTAAISIIGGILLGVPPLLSILFNGILMGAVISLMPGEFWRMIPHGIFELPAIFIAWGLGLWVGAAILEAPRWENLKRRLSKSLRILVVLIIPLLAIAAVIEGVAIHIYRG